MHRKLDGFRTTFDLKAALNEQRAFWKFIGIIFLIMLSFYALIIVGGVIVNALGFMSARPAS